VGEGDAEADAKVGSAVGKVERRSLRACLPSTAGVKDESALLVLGAVEPEPVRSRSDERSLRQCGLLASSSLLPLLLLRLGRRDPRGLAVPRAAPAAVLAGSIGARRAKGRSEPARGLPGRAAAGVRGDRASEARVASCDDERECCRDCGPYAGRSGGAATGAEDVSGAKEVAGADMAGEGGPGAETRRRRRRRRGSACCARLGELFEGFAQPCTGTPAP